MLALAGFLARIFPALAQYFMLGFRLWHVAMFAALLSMSVIFLDKILLVLGVVGAFILKIILAVVIRILLYLVEKLPGVPDDLPNTAWSTILGAASVAGRYIDLNLMLTYAGIMVSIFGAIYVYKLVKLVRGGG